MTDEAELERVTAELERLGEAVIDSSTLIYLEKANLLGAVSKTLELRTAPHVVRETGMEPVGISVVDIEVKIADDAVFEIAKSRQEALLSEDRKLLLRAERSGLRYYNAYLLLLMLLLRRIITMDRYEESKSILINVARYGKRVLTYANELERYIMKSR